MATQKQIDANRLNAQFSTGPRSHEAKARTRLNAKRDGITGQVITLSDEDRPIFETLKTELIDDLAPKTTMELRLANSIAWDTWRLDHLRAVEMNMYALGTQNPLTEMECDSPELHTAMSGALTFQRESKKLALMSIYEQRLNRSIHKNLATLRQLQAERKRDYEQDLSKEVMIAEANDARDSPYEAPTRRSQNGIVFSTAEVLAATNRKSVVCVATHTSVDPKKVQFPGAWEAYEQPGPGNKPNSGLKVAAAA
jgi:hypothetical protein